MPVFILHRFLYSDINIPIYSGIIIHNMTNREIAEKIFRKAVASVQPELLIQNQVKVNGSVLHIFNEELNLEEIEHIYIIGAGKATASMASAVEKILGKRIKNGHIVVKYGHSAPLQHISLTEAGHPVPDQNGFSATEKISAIASGAGINDLVICLISGGGSALLADSPYGITQKDLAELNDTLVRCGADIREINIVRKHVSGIKGGRLASITYPARLISLILSDVPGDSVESIASGPTCPDPSTFNDAMEVIERHGIKDKIPGSVLASLLNGVRGEVPESPKKDDLVFKRVSNYLIGTNRTALNAAADESSRMGLNTIIFNEVLACTVEKASDLIINEAIGIKGDNSVRKPVALLFGGETIIKVTGKGLGGRNQHLALSCALMLKEVDGITVLAAGTDGNDGPTDAAGAVVDRSTIKKALELNLNPGKYLAGFDSYNFFRLAGGHIITGPTMTNVMDIAVVIVE